jgi:hypothetical protein
MCMPDDRCAEVYDAEYQALYAAAGRAFADALREAQVDRYAEIYWVSNEGSSGLIDLEAIQGNRLLDILEMAGLPKTGLGVSSGSGDRIDVDPSRPKG